VGSLFGREGVLQRSKLPDWVGNTMLLSMGNHQLLT
jgi:hypothetical protein